MISNLMMLRQVVHRPEPTAVVPVQTRPLKKPGASELAGVPSFARQLQRAETPRQTTDRPPASGSAATAAPRSRDRRAADEGNPSQNVAPEREAKARAGDEDLAAQPVEDGATTQPAVAGEADAHAQDSPDDSQDTGDDDVVPPAVPVEESDEGPPEVEEGVDPPISVAAAAPPVASEAIATPIQVDTAAANRLAKKQPQQGQTAGIDRATSNRAAARVDPALPPAPAPQPALAVQDAAAEGADAEPVSPEALASRPAVVSDRPVATPQASLPSPPVAPGPGTTTGAPLQAAHATPATGAAMPTPQADAQDSPQEQAILARVVRGMQGALHQQGGAVTMRLTPPELGTIRIELAMQQGTVSARLHTENDSVRQLLTDQLTQLRAGLERQGLTVERLTVQTQQTMPSFSQQPGQDGSHGDGRSRGEYTPQGQRDARSHDDRQDQPDRPSQRRFEELLNAVG